MKPVLFFLLVILFFSCTSDSKKVEVQDEPTEAQDSTLLNEKDIENKLISMVDSLQEVMRLSNEIEVNSKSKNHLTIWISAKPEETKINYYWVKVGEDNGLNIATHYNFYVDPMSENILYYDIVNDTLITLDDWRKNK